MKFLVKEIRSKTGELHFRRWRFLETPWLRLYLHNIVKADDDKHEHDHPWSFITLILKGGYDEVSHRAFGDLGVYSDSFRPLQCAYHHATWSHRLTHLYGSTWTLVLAWGRKRTWGYRTESGWVDNETYRANKHAGMYK